MWSRRVTQEDNVELTPLFEKFVGASRSIKTITFDGLNDGKFRFTLEEVTPAHQSTKEFFFEVIRAAPTLVSIKGATFEVLSFDSISIRYRILKQFD